jgi:putative ABC transport system permease protein
MIFHYIKLSVRLLTRNPFYTFVNVTGLAIGFTSFITLWQYSSSELAADQKYIDFERIARIGFEWSFVEQDQQGHITFSASKADLPPMLKEDYPEIESFVRISEQAGFFQNDLHKGHGRRIVIATVNSTGDKKVFRETGVAYADRNLFGFFGIPLLYGDAESVLAGVNYVALSKSTAQKYFDGADPVGEILTLNDSIHLYVQGVYDDLPHGSRINYNMIISNEGLLTKWSNVYWGGTQNFIKVRNTSLNEFDKKLKANVKKYWAHILSTCNGCKITPFVQPLDEIAFNRGLIGDEGFQRKSKTMLITLGGIAVVVLAMAWINYINLTLSRISTRMKEFGTRRANGAGVTDVILQFLTEAALINLLAMGISLTIFQIIRSPLSIFFDIHIKGIWLIEASTWQPIVIIVLCGIIITGLYPAYICIRHQPRILLARFSRKPNKNPMSVSLTTFQFASAIVLIFWALVVYHQLNFILAKETGYNRNGIVTIEGPVTRQSNYQQSMEALAGQLKSLKNVKNITLSRYAIGEPGNKPGNITKLGTTISSGVECNAVDENFIPFFGLRILAGRNFVRDDRSDVVVISRPAAKAIGFDDPLDALGAKVMVGTGDWGVNKEAEVIGVIEDYRRFPFYDLSESNTVYAAGGLGIFLTYKNKLFPELISEFISASVDTQGVDALIGSMESTYKSHYPGNVFEWQFLDDRLAQVYINEKFGRNQILLFTILAIGIACLGLIAIMNHNIIERTKELGIRKILGAKSLQIGKLLIHSTLVQLSVAFFISIPAAFYLAQQYLQKYAERISLEWWYFLMPAGLLAAIMIFTISGMVIRAVRTNPVESLRYE